jgi:hypothetical protein
MLCDQPAESVLANVCGCVIQRFALDHARWRAEE